MLHVPFLGGLFTSTELEHHDGVFYWTKSAPWHPFAGTTPATLMPKALQPHAIRTNPCPECGYPEHFWAPEWPMLHRCMDCFHLYTILPVSPESWHKIKFLLSEASPWLKTRFRQLQTPFPVLGEWEEYLEGQEFQEVRGFITTTSTNFEINPQGGVSSIAVTVATDTSQLEDPTA